MGCNCKAQNNFNKIVSKYGDITPEIKDNKLNLKDIISVCLVGIGQILMGILLCVLFIIIAIPMVLYIGFCMIFGKEAHIKLLKFNKKK